MATIVEIKESKLENLAEYAEKVVRYGKKLMECLSELEGRDFPERPRKHPRDYDEEYPRYY